MTAFSPVEMRKRFHHLKAIRDGIREKVLPMRYARDAIEQEARLKCDAINVKIDELELPLPEVKAEMAVIVRALNGKTGKPDGTV